MSHTPSRDLVLAVTAFRDALEGYSRKHPDSSWKDFPAGCCFLASTLLARFLAETGHGAADRITDAWRPVPNEDQPESHAWLCLGGIVIDITADQFPRQRRVIVSVGETPFHRSFEGRKVRPYDPASHKSLNAVYRAILREVKR